MLKKKSYPIIFAILILLSITYGARVISNSIYEGNRKLMEISSNASEIKSLKKDISDLKEEIEDSNNMEFVEKVAREDLGMVKPREIIYIDKNKVFNEDLKNN